MAKSDRARNITIGVLLGFLPTIGVAWAFAVTAAEHVMGPHLESARYRVEVMCSWAEVMTQNQTAICEATGAKCHPMDARVLLAGCEEK